MRRLGPVSTLIEWDDRIPEFETLAAEAARAREILARVAREEEWDGASGAAALGAVQHWLRQLITEPSGVEAALAAEGDAQARGSPRSCVATADWRPAIGWRCTRTPISRVSTTALRDDFGALARRSVPRPSTTS